MTSPGTWHVSAPTKRVDWPVAMDAWTRSTVTILEAVAASGGSISYEQLRGRVFDVTGYRTGMLTHQWARQVLERVQEVTWTLGKPPLAALVVRTGDREVGAGYVNHEYPGGFASSSERQRAAAPDRRSCYLVYRDGVASGAGPQWRPLNLNGHAARANPAHRSSSPILAVRPSTARICSSCFTALPASGRCDYCT